MSEPTVQPSPGAPLDESDRRRDQRAWCWYDWANSVFPTSIITVFLSVYLTTVARNDALAAGQPCFTRNALVGCNISLFGLAFPAGSLFDYLLAGSTLLQVLVLPLTGAIADRTQHKRRMLGLFAFTGAAATALLALVAGTNWRLGVVLFIVATTGYYASVVIYYSAPDGPAGRAFRGENFVTPAPPAPPAPIYGSGTRAPLRWAAVEAGKWGRVRPGRRSYCDASELVDQDGAGDHRQELSIVAVSTRVRLLSPVVPPDGRVMLVSRPWGRAASKSRDRLGVLRERVSAGVV